ncbi:MAG: protein jag [Clostridia bacterium]|nr:protein jag [Clostridia bacterium]
MENLTYTYEGSSVEEAIEKGLAELNLTRDDVEVDVKAKGGFFTKAQVVLTVKPTPVVEPEVIESAEGEITEEEFIAAEERVRNFINELIIQMGLDCEAEVKREGSEINVNITGKGASSAIGYRGEVLDAIQYITLWIANSERKDFVRVSLDAENYRGRRKETLSRLAERLAHKCHKFGRRVELEPMNPFERRVIHTTLQNDRFVRTESEGEGRFRHVVILPKEEVKRERKPQNKAQEESVMTYGTSAQFRRKGIAKTKSYGAPSKKPF